MRYKIGDVIKGEGHTLKIIYVGSFNYFCEVVAVEDHHDEVGDEVLGCGLFLEKRYEKIKGVKKGG